jgi:hypothetical protein
MTEEKQNTVSVRIWETTLRGLKKAQHESFLNGDPEPSYAELLGKAWIAMEDNGPPAVSVPQQSPFGNLSPEQEQQVRALINLMESDDKNRKEMVRLVLNPFRASEMPDPKPHSKGKKRA